MNDRADYFPGSSTPIRATRAYIDLDALSHNVELLAARAPGCALAPAVKADAYGHGIEAVAIECDGRGVAMFAVATVEEAATLADLGVSAPALILQDLFREDVEAALQMGARLGVGSVDYARLIAEVARKTGTTARVHINVDTGMGRMGLLSDKPAEEIKRIASLPALELEGVFSHFPSSDESEKTFSQLQMRSFAAILADLRAEGMTPRLRHIGNSGALIDFPADSAFDMIRPGIALYGVEPSEEVDRTLGLKPVMRLVSRLIRVSRYNREWTIGYGRTYRVGPGSVIGIVPIGYGDGYARLFSNRAEVLIHGRRVPVAGRVSMDMIAVDVTRLTEAVRSGDEVVLLGSQHWNGRSDHIDALELARYARTISYEITCSVAPRVPRLYTRSGDLVAFKSARLGYRSAAM